MAVKLFPAEAVRGSLDDLPETLAATTEQPNPRELFVVPGHERALDPDSTLVVGDRGTGKSFWSAALNGDLTRRLIAAQLPRLKLDRVDVSWGFSVATHNQTHPSRRVLQQLWAEFDAEDIWRSVILHQLADRYDEPLATDTWAERVHYVVADPEREERLRDRISEHLREKRRRHLIIFDALDRTGSDWKAIRGLVRGLLQVCLDLQGLAGIQAKLFMRPDMWEDKRIWQFPDSSKLHHGRVNLEWRRADLYGLLFHWLSNHADGGEPFRDWLDREHRLPFEAEPAEEISVYPIPKRLRQDESLQQKVLHGMATRYMGTNARRGRTYTWLPNHLADAKGQVSPRSFLIAIREAHRDTQSRGHKEVLHWDGIKRGVQDASRVRVTELGEDYPWIQEVLAPLKGQTVPCRDQDIEHRWVEAGVVEAIDRDQATALERTQVQSDHDEEDDRFFLPPHALDAPGSDRPERALLQELERIGVIRRIDEERVDIPDLFRVAAAIGRRGGVRPIR
ncbi:MAG: hypothetical protein LGR52_05645 [Candidatus Thiosymbion ectosymbiont of Robbea hypermnestra]|nr:hypothetical protein [Candidatus Thiosymbion ectosymbiont of Robbea hypermnestra]